VRWGGDHTRAAAVSGANPSTLHSCRNTRWQLANPASLLQPRPHTRARQDRSRRAGQHSSGIGAVALPALYRKHGRHGQHVWAASAHRPGAIPATKPYEEARCGGAARGAAGGVRRRCSQVQAIPLPPAAACRPRAWRAALKIGWGPLPAVKYAERAVGSEHQPPAVVQVDAQRSQAGKRPTAVCVRDSHEHASEGEAGQRPPAGCRHACDASATHCVFCCGCSSQAMGADAAVCHLDLDPT